MGHLELQQLKKDYSVFEKKYKLPSFEELNRNFEIEKIERQSDILLRIIRAIMMDKIIAIQRFIESILNPANAPRILYKYIKSVSQEETKNLEQVYEKFALLTLKVLSLDVEYNESAEAKMINEIYKTWQDTKDNLNKIIESVQNPKEQQSKREKSYFG